MPWKNVSPMEQKQQFVSLLSSGQFTVSELCRIFGNSTSTKRAAEYFKGRDGPGPELDMACNLTG